MKKSRLFVVDIDKETVRSKSISGISKLLRELESDPALHAQKIVIGFAYDDVPEEVFQIEEVREWVKLLFIRHPYFLFYACSEANTDQILLFCLCAEISVFFDGEYISQDEYVQKHGKLDKIQTVVRVGGIGPLLEKCMLEIRNYSNTMGIPLKGEEVIKLLLDRWLKKLIKAE